MAQRERGRPGWWRPAALAWGLWGLTLLAVPVLVWFDRLLRDSPRPDRAVFTADSAAFLVGALSAATVGALLAGRRPRHPVGWLLLTLGLVGMASGVSYAYASYGLLARPGSLPAAWIPALDIGTLPLAVCLAFVLLLTPTGSLPSGRGWRHWAWVAVGAAVVSALTLVFLPLFEPYPPAANPLAIAAVEDPLTVVSNVTFAVAGLSLPVGALSLVLRFRRARGVERQQLRWVALAAGLVMVLALALAALVPLGNETVLGWLSSLIVALLPLAIAAAILRYRLYDLDRIISRALAYALLTLLLGLGYTVVVLGLGQLLGRDSSLVVAAATLAVAAVFRPARGRVQRVVDRRFNRRRYDAARTIQAFSARLRQQVDLDALSDELLGVVDQAMQPTRASLWLRPTRS